MASKDGQAQSGKDPASTITPPISRADVVWQGFLGKEVNFCRADDFVSGISRYIQHKLSSTERKRLLLKVDEKGLGYVFQSSFSDMVGSEEVAEAISYYSADPHLPLLVWVDDDLQNNARKASDARKYGVTVVQLTSTASAKNWISVNKEFLRKHDSAENVRYITDQVRVEANHEGVESKNWHAGDQIVEFIRREMKLKAPILVYTGRRSISVTGYVESFTKTGSFTSNYSLFQQYVFQLGARKSDTPLLKFNM
ncbi:hypothetical protein BJ165DRAFT_391 [Panaeolus papilionaceus]|nr:hypothetical protein BJ165DRAFT_391 [Panaeolus papilionaceus]